MESIYDVAAALLTNARYVSQAVVPPPSQRYISYAVMAPSPSVTVGTVQPRTTAVLLEEVTDKEDGAGGLGLAVCAWTSEEVQSKQMQIKLKPTHLETGQECKNDTSGNARQ